MTSAGCVECSAAAEVATLATFGAVAMVSAAVPAVLMYCHRSKARSLQPKVRKDSAAGMRDDAGRLASSFEFLFNIFGYLRQLVNYAQQVGATTAVYNIKWCVLQRGE